MKRRVLIAVCACALAAPAMAMDHSQMKGEMDHGKMSGDMDHSGHMGEMIHESTVDGYKIAYHVIDNKAQMAKMKDMKGMQGMQGQDMSQMKSHHLMAYVTDPSGKPVSDCKVGYKVIGPDGKEQMAMTMGMTGGFGADVDFEAKGTYIIKTKAVAGETKLMDEFSYTVK